MQGKGQDLDELLTTNFDKWWKGHSHLFVETPTRLTEMQQGEVAETHDYYKYFRVDTRMTTTNIIKDLRLHLEKSRRANAWTSQWVPTGEYRQEKLFNCYNGLVMWLQGKTTEEILTSGLLEQVVGRKLNTKWILVLEEHNRLTANIKQEQNTKKLRQGRIWKGCRGTTTLIPEEQVSHLQSLTNEVRRQIWTRCEKKYSHLQGD